MMKYLLRDGKVEYSGNKQQIIDYINECYEDDYWVQQYGKIFNKDFDKFLYTLQCLGLQLSNKMPKYRRR